MGGKSNSSSSTKTSNTTTNYNQTSTTTATNTNNAGNISANIDFSNLLGRPTLNYGSIRESNENRQEQEATANPILKNSNEAKNDNRTANETSSSATASAKAEGLKASLPFPGLSFAGFGSALENGGLLTSLGSGGGGGYPSSYNNANKQDSDSNDLFNNRSSTSGGGHKVLGFGSVANSEGGLFMILGAIAIAIALFIKAK